MEVVHAKAMIKRAFEVQKAGLGYPLLCPRCGKNEIKPDLATNAFSRHESIYICSDCGTDEAMRDYAKMPCVPLEKWYAIRLCEDKEVPDAG